MSGLDDQEPSKPSFDQVTSKTSLKSTAIPNAEQKAEQEALEQEAFLADRLGIFKENAADITVRPETNQPPPQGSSPSLDLKPPVYAPDRSTEVSAINKPQRPRSMLTPTGRLGGSERAQAEQKETDIEAVKKTLQLKRSKARGRGR